MLDFLRRLLTALIVFVFVLPISAVLAGFVITLFILGLPFKGYDLIAGTMMYEDLTEFLFICCGLVIFLITMPYHILTDN
jgi:hypothetical protein